MSDYGIKLGWYNHPDNIIEDKGYLFRVSKTTAKCVYVECFRYDDTEDKCMYRELNKMTLPKLKVVSDIRRYKVLRDFNVKNRCCIHFQPCKCGCETKDCWELNDIHFCGSLQLSFGK